MKNPTLFKTAFNSYSVEAPLGEGGAGRVYRVKDSGGQLLALKCLHPESTTDARKRSKNEITFCFRTNHPHVVKVLDFGLLSVNGAECPFYVMPLFKGTLHDLMEKGIPPDRVLPYFSQVLDGVEAAHLLKTWHRDLKPKNILHDATNDRLVVADFGIAHFSEELLQTLVETSGDARLANFQYAAPEQRKRGAQVDYRADIFGLALILNEMFTGERPEGSGHKLIADVAPAYGYLDDLVDQMRRQDPAARPSSIDEVKKILIGRKNDSVSRQRLSALKAEVIPQSKTDDPLRDTPVTLVELVDYSGSQLVLRLSQPVSTEWIRIFHAQQGEYRSGYPPRVFQFEGDRVTANVAEGYVQDVVDFFKRFLVRAHHDYVKHIDAEAQRREAEAHRALQARIAEEEKKRRILTTIKI
jgi:serine/threonine protein kinase